MGIDFSNFLNVIDDMENVAKRMKKSEATAVSLAANAYKNDVQEVIQYKTGTLRRSIHVENQMEGLSPVSVVGTDVPYARRLEYGFISKDSLERQYHQYAAPRWRPTFDNNLRKYERIIRDALDGKVGGDQI